MCAVRVCAHLGMRSSNSPEGGEQEQIMANTCDKVIKIN